MEAQRTRVVFLTSLGLSAATVMLAAPAARAQITYVNDYRGIQVYAEAAHLGELDQQGDDLLPDFSFAPFNVSTSVQAVVSQATASAGAGQWSSLTPDQIVAGGSASVSIDITAGSSNANANANCYFTIEFHLDAPGTYTFLGSRTGDGFGELYDLLGPTLETLDIQTYSVGYLEPGDYAVDVGAEPATSWGAPISDDKAAQFRVAFTLGEIGCINDFAFSDFTDTTDLWFVGDAAVGPNDELRITPDVGDKVGAVWHWNGKGHLADGFETTFTIRITGSGFDGDGMAFVIQDDSPTAVGGGGSGLGYDGIPRSLAVEFDTFAFNDEIPSDHVSVQTQGVDPNSSGDFASLAATTLGYSLKDGQPHLVRVRYLPGSLKVYVDGASTPTVTANVDLQDISGNSILDENGCAWIGFAAATGGASEDHDVLDWTVGPPSIEYAPADFDHDGDVDLADFGHFLTCFNGPNRAPSQTDCANTDFDSDNDVDLSDFSVFLTCFNGPNRPAACPS